MPGAGDHPFVTTAIAILFVVGLLYKNWVVEIRDWIEDKVSS
jgi:hypothetical protein